MSLPSTARLGDVASFVRGITFKPDDVVRVGSPGAAACMRTKNVQAELDLSDVWGIPESFVKRQDQYLSVGDLLVSSANSWNLVGKCCWVGQLPWPATFGGFVSVLRGNKARIEPRFLYHWFSSPRIQATLRSFGQQTTNISNLNVDRCLRLSLPLPPLPEQQRIAAILDKADDLRTKRTAALAQLDTLPQSIFLDMFGDPATNPNDPTFEPLGTHLTFVTSGGRGWARYYAPSGSRFIRSLDVRMNRIGSGDMAFVDAPDNAEARRTRVSAGDVLLTITGSRIGRVAVVPNTLEGSYISQHVAILRVDTRRIEPTFLSFFLSLKAGGQRQIAKAQYGQTKPGLNFEQMRRFLIPVPPIELQREFTHRLRTVEGQKSALHESHAQLDSLFASLHHHAFRGEL